MGYSFAKTDSPLFVYLCFQMGGVTYMGAA